MSGTPIVEPLIKDSPKNSTRGWKLCKCNECGEEAICTPSHDFYIEDADKDLESAYLYCKGCLIARHRKREGLKPDYNDNEYFVKEYPESV